MPDLADRSIRSMTARSARSTVDAAARPRGQRGAARRRCAWWMTFPMTVVDTIFKALAPAIPDRVIAGHHADLCVAPRPRHRRPTDGSFFISRHRPARRRLGRQARPRTASSPRSASMTATPITARASRSRRNIPLLVERYALRAGFRRRRPIPRRARRRDGRAGAAPISTLNASIDRVHCLPWGLDGGLEGAGNEVLLRRDGDGETDFANAKVFDRAS